MGWPGGFRWYKDPADPNTINPEHWEEMLGEDRIYYRAHDFKWGNNAEAEIGDLMYVSILLSGMTTVQVPGTFRLIGHKAMVLHEGSHRQIAWFMEGIHTDAAAKWTELVGGGAVVTDMIEEVAKVVERGWCQYRSALNANGEGTSAYAPEAVSWCIHGAMNKVRHEHPELGTKDWIDMHTRLRMAAGVDSIVHWNDEPGRTKEQVLDLLKSAA